MKYCKVMDYSLITKLFYTFSPKLLACSRNGIVFLKRLISAIRKVQMPLPP